MINRRHLALLVHLGKALGVGALLVTTPFPVAATSWTRTYGGVYYERPMDVRPTSDGGFVLAGETGSFGAGDHDLWILKLAATGEIEWQAAYGGRRIDGNPSIQPLPDGGFVIAADTHSLDLLATDRLWVLRLDPAGNIVWQRLGGEIGGNVWSHLRALRDGGWIVGSNPPGGAWQLTRFEADGDVAWQASLERPRGYNRFCDIIEADDGTLFACGHTADAYSATDWDGWIVRLDAGGNVLWQKRYDLLEDETLWNLRDMGAEGLVAYGSTSDVSGRTQPWVLRLNSGGDVVWARTFVDPVGCYQFGAVLDLPSGFVVAASSCAFGAGAGDGVILRLDDSGNILRQQAHGGADRDRIYWLAPTGDGGYLAAGFTYSFGAGHDDIWLLRHDALGNIPASCHFMSDSGLVSVESIPIVQDTDSVMIPTSIAFTPTNGVRTPTAGITTLLCDGAPLECDDAVASPPLLWPPDHRMIPVEVSSLSLEASGASIVITGVRSDEPMDDRGDGSFAPDAVLQGGSIVLLRAERDGRGNGRVYTIDFTGTDGSGATCDGSVTVGVPKSQGRRMGPIDDGPLFDATAESARRGGRGHRR